MTAMTKTTITRPSGGKEFLEDILTRCCDDPRRCAPTIRRLARYEKLAARKSRRDGRWYFSDPEGRLVSPETGLTDQETLQWLVRV